MTRLVVTADDFGASPAVNAAVVRAHRDGILTAASLMVTGAAAADAVALARSVPSLAIGLHLVLVQGVPAADPAEIPGLLAPDGRFPDAPVSTGFRHAWRSVVGRGAVELRREVEAQLEMFARTGLRLAHLDGHLNMHLHPMVLPHVIDLAPRFGLGVVRLLRDDLGLALRHDRRHLGRKLAEEAVFRALGAWAAPRLRAAGLVAADRVYGLHQTGSLDEGYLLALVSRLGGSASELYCHPTTAGGGEELAALTSPRVRSALDAAGVRLVGSLAPA